MWQPAEEEPRGPERGGLLESLTSCLNALIRCCMCSLCLEEPER